MENVEVLFFNDFYILISKVNGNTLTVDESVFNDADYLCDLLNEHDFFEDIETSSEYNKELKCYGDEVFAIYIINWIMLRLVRKEYKWKNI